MDKNISEVVRETYDLPDNIIVYSNKPVFDEHSFERDLFIGFNPNDGHADPMMGGPTFQWVVGHGYDREKDNFSEIISFTAVESGGGSKLGVPASEGNRHFDSIKALYEAGKLQILEPGQQPKFSDIVGDYLKIDGQNIHSDFEWDDYFAETLRVSLTTLKMFI